MLHTCQPRLIYVTNIVWLSNIGLIVIVGLCALKQTKISQVNQDMCHTMDKVQSNENIPRILFPSDMDFIVEKCIKSETSDFTLLSVMGFDQIYSFISGVNNETQKFVNLKNTQDKKAIINY